ncbi:zinc finger CCCH domain-containing protein 7B [Rhincodon typus]|uniref:zinc finger CCCH domain-containing protein 7B n=1 Tax=Rhincodon typus TaxID=259920 RepID=UPI00202E043C|nr:zinc finger CCCH domain-containing protein 7B [Rhincodon typus]XP_048473392.1 zinc finger CCCH domain-containing protein 7B [Rhincodon typus]
MSSTSPGRQKRKEEIQKGLHFIQSPLPYPGSQDEYETFLHQLVKNLLEEGNGLYRESDYKLALAQYVEALNVAQYAESDEVVISQRLLEKLYVNRAACYFSMGMYEKALEDCESTLKLNETNYRALYRKTQALNALGRHKEAYECIAKCSFAVPQDENVVKLTQELAQKLGLRIRKAYIRAQQDMDTVGLTEIGHSVNSSQVSINGTSGIDDIESGSPLELPRIPVPATIPAPVSEVSVPISSVSVSIQQTQTHSTLLKTPVGDGVSLSVPETTEEFPDEEIIGEELDTLLDSIGEANDFPMTSVAGTVPTNLPSDMPRLLPIFRTGSPVLPSALKGNIGSKVSLPSAYPMLSVQKMDSLDSIVPNTIVNSLDSLDLLPATESRPASRPMTPNSNQSTSSSFALGKQSNSLSSLSSSSTYLGVVRGDSRSFLSSSSPLTKNPLSDTHDLRQACSSCFVKIGIKALDYNYNPDLDHKCGKDILIGRLKSSTDTRWKKIRPRPTKNNYGGPYYICKDIASKEDCKYGDQCTFAYCQEEIDVWTLERKGAINRELLFDPLGGDTRGSLTVAKLLKEHLGCFMFLCEECFDSKPRLISKKAKDSTSLCSNPDAKHNFEDNKCLVHMLCDTTVKYSKIRQYQDHCQFDVCRHEVRYGCLREDSCNFAHSLIELKVWVMQQSSEITHEEIVQESTQHCLNVEASVSRAQVPSGAGKVPSLGMKMKFVCSQCWRNGQVVEPDKNLKYCSAKIRHGWTKERRVMLVMSSERKKWVAIRPLPSCRNIPQQYDLCTHVAKGKKCQYVGNCSFAHSLEELDVWTYMKETKMYDMQQVYEMWLKNQKPMMAGEPTELSTKQSEKQIHMPTDYADVGQIGYHCWLCGKNSNSEKQWAKHITSEKHKDKVFNSEDDQNCWQHRFPMGEFKLCERQRKKSCPDGDKCQFAHSQSELEEWIERRDLMKMKFAKARKDMLIAPDDNDFGKYSFLMKDLN